MGSSPRSSVAVDPAIREGAFLLAGGDLSRSSGRCPRGSRSATLWIESGRTLADLKALTDPFDPLTYASRLRGKRVFMMAGKVDEVVPPASARAPLGSGRPAADSLVRLRPLFGRRLPPAGDPQTVDFFESRGDVRARVETG